MKIVWTTDLSYEKTNLKEWFKRNEENKILEVDLAIEPLEAVKVDESIRFLLIKNPRRMFAFSLAKRIEKIFDSITDLVVIVFNCDYLILMALCIAEEARRFKVVKNIDLDINCAVNIEGIMMQYKWGD